MYDLPLNILHFQKISFPVDASPSTYNVCPVMKAAEADLVAPSSSVLVGFY
jgi:hypothetical protein